MIEPILKFQKLWLRDNNIDYTSPNNKSILASIVFTFAVGIVIIISASSITFQNTEASIGIAEETGDTNIKINNNNDNNSYPLSKLFNQVQQSVVQISSSGDKDISQQLGFRLGSGFVYDKNGHIITNNHVVGGSSSDNEILVTFSDGSIYRAQIVGSDPHSDLAVVKINTIQQEKLKPLVLGNSSELVIGQPVAAVGNPFGLSGSMTEGIVSGLGRLLPSIPSQADPLFGRESSSSAVIGAFSIPDIIQTDAAINPGNSGGPLLNMKGEVIGINSAIFSNTGVYAGVGFAIPSNIVKKVVPSLIEKGTYDHPWLGVIGTDITPAIAEAMNLNLTEAKGFLVTGINANSPADKAGIKGGDRVLQINGIEMELGGDIIIGIDGKPVRKIDDVISHLEREKMIGEQVTLTLIRNGETLQKTLTLEERPGSEQTMQGSRQQQPSLGVTGTDVTPAIAEAMNLNLTDAKGFLVTEVRADGPAAEAGIKGGYEVAIINNTQIRLGGDVIVGIDNKTVETVEEIKDYVNTKDAGDIVNVKVIRNGEIQNIDVKLEVLPNAINRENVDPFGELNPFGRDRGEESNKDPFDNQLPFLEDLEKQCLQTFNDSICNFLFK
jgi:serine protease Do